MANEYLPPITTDQAIKIAEVYSRMALGVSVNNGPRAESYARVADIILQKFIAKELRSAGN